MCSILRNPESRLQTLNIACNEFSVEHLELLHLSLVNNKVLSGIDMRGNQGYDKGTDDTLDSCPSHFSSSLDSHSNVPMIVRSLIKYFVTYLFRFDSSGKR